jgi:hypothetical protein
MSTTGSKFLFALSAFGLLAAVVYGLSTGGDIVGVLTGGYKGGVGEHLGYVVLVALGVTAGFLGGMMAAFRDADPASVAEIAATDALARADAPFGASYWPIIGSFGAAILLLGVVVGPPLFVLGAVVLVIAIVEWTVRAWSDRATGDPEVNRLIRNRLMYPVEIPVLAVLVIGGVAIGFSRVFLALSQAGATIFAIIMSSLVFGIAAVVATRPKISRSVVSGLILAGGLAVLVGGVVGASVGERDFEQHSEEHADESDGDHGDGAVDEGTDSSEDGSGGSESGTGDEEGA